MGTVVRRFQAQSGTRTVYVEAAGYRGDFQNGFEEASLALMDEMQPSRPSPVPTVNVLGFGADDPRLSSDLAALEQLMEGKVQVGTVFARCTREEIYAAPPRLGLNLVFGRGLALAKEMERRFGIPYACLDYPCGLVGAKALWKSLEQHFGLDFSKEEQAFQYPHAGWGCTGLLLPAGPPRHACGGGGLWLPALGGLAAFLSRELGVSVEVQAQREDVQDLEELYDQIRQSEAVVPAGVFL